MTDELNNLKSKPLFEESIHIQNTQKPDSKNSKKKLLIILLIVFTVICLISILCITVLGVGTFKTNKEKTPIESILDSYMQFMSNKNAEGAYELFSPRAQRQIPISELNKLLEGNNYLIFEGYQSLSVTNFKISKRINTNPDVPQGTVAEVTGIINFKDGIQGTFNGVLEKVNESWMIDSVYVSVPPDKIK